MNKIQTSITLLGVAALASSASAQLLTNQQNGYFTAAQWAAMLPSLQLNNSGSNNGTVPLPAVPPFQSSNFLLNSGFDDTLASYTIDVVWFSETAGRSTNDVFLTLNNPGGTVQIVDNAQSPGNPAFGTSDFYTVDNGFDFLINPLGSVASQFGLLRDGLEGSRFKWSTFFYSEQIGNVINDYTYYLFGVEDRVANGDADFTDLVFGFGILDSRTTQVPEPSTYGALGAALVAGLILRRKFRKKAA